MLSHFGTMNTLHFGKVLAQKHMESSQHTGTLLFTTQALGIDLAAQYPFTRFDGYIIQVFHA